MKTRIITGALMALVFIPIFVFGGWLLYGILGFMSVVASYEMMNMIKTKAIVPLSVYVLAIVYNVVFYMLIVYGLLTGSMNEFVFPMLLGLILIGSLFMVFVEDMHFDLLAKTILAIMYPVLGFASLVVLRDLGLAFLGLLFVITVSTDVFAYFVGVSIGKHKLAPKISPKKSIEGSIGGILFAVIFSIVYVLLVNRGEVQIDMPLWLMAIVVIFASSMAQVGDLVASKMKRTYGIKDFSNIFPGHGGVMDRFDSSLFASMLFVFFIVLGLV